MNASTTCCDGPCTCGTGATARLRYTFGQRLTAVDLLDEQSYHRAKDRFVNQHVLGYGLLCGLAVERGGGPPDLTPTLRVRRGTALDACGNAITVGNDQCIDVSAWFATHRDELGWTEPGDHGAWIGLRYKECPGDPVAVPRDPCGCGHEGCAYSRVHESFELALHADDGPIHPVDHPPGRCAGGTLASGLPACPDCDCDPWLLVAAIDVTVSDPGAGARLQATEVSEPDITDRRRIELFTLQALQDLVERLSVDSEPCAQGPRIGGVTGGGTTTDAGDLDEVEVVVQIDLATDADGADVPLVAETIADPPLRLHRLGDAGWEEPASAAERDEATGTLRATSSDVAVDQWHRLALGQHDGGTVDERLQPLRPTAWSIAIRWTTDEAGDVVVEVAP